GIDVKPIPPDQLSEIRRQLSAIGNNINQIARVANGTGRIGKEDIDAIKSMQTQIWHQVKTF
ncbi:MAG: MobC family plasmid mobilization relaxosome protein, partial [Clostridiales bacterium]|nr:MobC family plasmid mobilization relaxosome protein [Clostridiales bacterium]